MKYPNRNFSHGNHHFDTNDRVKLAKRDSFVIYLQGLNTVYRCIQRKHFSNISEGSFIKRWLNAKKEWEEFNDSLQLVIDNKRRELEQESKEPISPMDL